MRTTPCGFSSWLGETLSIFAMLSVAGSRGSALSPLYFGAAYAAALCLADRISAPCGAC